MAPEAPGVRTVRFLGGDQEVRDVVVAVHAVIARGSGAAIRQCSVPVGGV
jgi:hypothetical protein